MFAILLLLFILVPVAELSLLIRIGQQIGVFPTIFLIIATGIAGAWLTRAQGFRIWIQIRTQIHRGEFPGDELIEGVLIFVGGLTLLTPGFITDAIGLLCLIPPTRRFFREVIKHELKKRMKSDPADKIYTDFRVEDE